MATTTSAYFPLATESAYSGGPDAAPGTAGASGSGSDAADSAAGASGTSTPTGISHGAMVAIIVIVCVVGVFGTASSVLFYLAKKREWKVRETVRRSARKVVTALTPRRSEFPRSVKDGPSRSRAGRVRLDDVPPTPRLRPEDLEKGLGGVEVKRKGSGRR